MNTKEEQMAVKRLMKTRSLVLIEGNTGGDVNPFPTKVLSDGSADLILFAGNEKEDENTLLKKLSQSMGSRFKGYVEHQTAGKRAGEILIAHAEERKAQSQANQIVPRKTEKFIET
jgi:hypothetical protein